MNKIEIALKIIEAPINQVSLKLAEKANIVLLDYLSQSSPDTKLEVESQAGKMTETNCAACLCDTPYVNQASVLQCHCQCHE